MEIIKSADCRYELYNACALLVVVRLDLARIADQLVAVVLFLPPSVTENSPLALLSVPVSM